MMFKTENKLLIYLNIAIPVIYNPLIPIHSTKAIWTIINIATIIVMILNMIVNKTTMNINKKNLETEFYNT